MDKVDRCGGRGGSVPGAIVDEVIEFVDRFERRSARVALEALKRLAEMLRAMLDEDGGHRRRDD